MLTIACTEKSSVNLLVCGVFSAKSLNCKGNKLARQYCALETLRCNVEECF